jgi:hypothetical protein
VIVTNLYSQEWYLKGFKYSKIHVIEQGFHGIKYKSGHSLKDFICAYSLNYIHYGEDLDSNHSTWGAKLLLDVIIPGVLSLEPSVNLYSIGAPGRNAQKDLNKSKHSQFWKGQLGAIYGDIKKRYRRIIS